MDRDFTNLQHLYVRTPQDGDGELHNIMIKDYYDHHLIKESTYNNWLNKDYDAYYKGIKDGEVGKSSVACFSGVKTYLYYLIENGNIVGSGSVRLDPENNPNLSLTGGHIGYGVMPSKRRQGYGAMFLHLLLKESQKFGLKDVMVTCAEDNLGSAGVIETNFGLYLDMAYDQERECNFKRYIIDVDKSIEEFERRYIKTDSRGRK